MTRVLLVDDEPLVLIGMQGMLNWAALGYEVVGTARNGAEALRAVQEKQPDIVVSDIRMPVMDGFALAEACHKDGSALPAFIMLTSYEEFDYVKRSMRLGVVDYLVKIDPILMQRKKSAPMVSILLTYTMRGTLYSSA